jgi:hypothetical protein
MTPGRRERFVRLVGAPCSASRATGGPVAKRYMGSEGLAKARLRPIEGQVAALSNEPELRAGAA